MSVLNTYLDSGYTLHHGPINTGRRGGGVGVFNNNQIKVKTRILCVNPEIISIHGHSHHNQFNNNSAPSYLSHSAREIK